MTYDVLKKATKEQLISWIRKNVILPNYSDEEFLKQIKLDSLMAKQQKLLERSGQLNEELNAAKGNGVKFMSVLIECQKLDEQENKIDREINSLLGI